MPRLISCIDQSASDEPILDSQAFWVRLPDGTRARDGNGKLLAFRNRENAIAEARAINAYLKENGLEPQAAAVPPEQHQYEQHRAVVQTAYSNTLAAAASGGAAIPGRQTDAGKNARATS